MVVVMVVMAFTVLAFFTFSFMMMPMARATLTFLILSQRQINNLSANGRSQVLQLRRAKMRSHKGKLAAFDGNNGKLDRKSVV